MMDPSTKNLRQWVGLLFTLFCVLDIAGLQYSIRLIDMAPDHPEPALGRTVALIHGARQAWSYVYVTTGQITVLYGFLGAAGAALLATLSVVVGNGMRQALAERERDRRQKPWRRP